MLLHIPTDVLAKASATFEPMTRADAAWKVRHRDAVAGLSPWLELSPTRPTWDTRVPQATEPGASALLETFGGITGPGVHRQDIDEVVLGGNPVALGAPPPQHASGFRRECTLRFAMAADGVGSHRQCLVMFVLRGYDNAFVQTFLGTHRLGEAALVGETRLALLFDIVATRTLELDVHLRLAGFDAAARMGVLGVQVHLL